MWHLKERLPCRDENPREEGKNTFKADEIIKCPQWGEYIFLKKKIQDNKNVKKKIIKKTLFRWVFFFFFAFEPLFLVISTRKKPKNTSQTKGSISEVNTVGATV